MKVFPWFVGLIFSVGLRAQSAVTLPLLTVAANRIANESPAGTFAMPVSALRFEPSVDLQTRNLAEGQADVTMRGGIFENTAFQVGAVTVSDPQTGHYLAELPIAPAMLSAPEIRTGADLALGASNATVGAVDFGWRPIRTGGALGFGWGEHGFKKTELYQGFLAPVNPVLGKFGVDVAVAHSEATGAVPFGEHRFDRLNLRLQHVRGAAQTDLFGGYQSKYFGWPNLYTPFNSNETENLQTMLLAVNHRWVPARGEFFEAGAYLRRNKDDYAYNRFAPLGPVHPFQHTTWVRGLAAGGRLARGEVALGFRAEVLADQLKSTSLTFGRYHSRTLGKVALVPERTWTAGDGTHTRLQAGWSAEDTNRDGGALSPVLRIDQEMIGGALRRVYLSMVDTSQVPTYTALNSNAAAGLFRGNATLGRSRSRSWEWGGDAALGDWEVRGALFWRRDRALVDWTFRRGVTARTANAVDIEVMGLEWVARRSWLAGELILGYTALGKDADYRGAVVDASFYALNYARHRLTAAGVWRFAGGWVVKVDNEVRSQAANLLRTVGGDRDLQTALGLSYRPPAWSGVELSLVVDNAWNRSYQELPAVPAARRQLSLGAHYGW
jgi:vitamin B12 transporter